MNPKEQRVRDGLVCSVGVSVCSWKGREGAIQVGVTGFVRRRPW